MDVHYPKWYAPISFLPSTQSGVPTYRVKGDRVAQPIIEAAVSEGNGDQTSAVGVVVGIGRGPAAGTLLQEASHSQEPLLSGQRTCHEVQFVASVVQTIVWQAYLIVPFAHVGSSSVLRTAPDSDRTDRQVLDYCEGARGWWRLTSWSPSSFDARELGRQYCTVQERRLRSLFGGGGQTFPRGSSAHSANEVIFRPPRFTSRRLLIMWTWIG